MNEAEWLKSRRAGQMIWSLFSRMSGGGRIKDERFRRFGIACCRRALAALPGGNSPALDLLEASIGAALVDALPDVRKRHQTQMKTSTAAPFGESARRHAAATVLKCANWKPTMAAMAHEWALSAVVAMRGHKEGWQPGPYPRQPRHQAAVDEEHAIQADFVRDIFQNPFRPVALDPAWRTDTVVALARQIYESREFAAMPILADALQDAGCDNDSVLNHCRDTNQPHARGCWVLDLVLEKIPCPKPLRSPKHSG